MRGKIRTLHKHYRTARGVSETHGCDGSFLTWTPRKEAIRAHEPTVNLFRRRTAAKYGVCALCSNKSHGLTRWKILASCLLRSYPKPIARRCADIVCRPAGLALFFDGRIFPSLTFPYAIPQVCGHRTHKHTPALFLVLLHVRESFLFFRRELTHYHTSRVARVYALSFSSAAIRIAPLFR